MSNISKNLVICAFCPNTCRPAIAAQGIQVEAQTPSALALITVAVLQGRIALDDQTRAVLARRDAVNASVGHCTYKLDMPRCLTTRFRGWRTDLRDKEQRT